MNALYPYLITMGAILGMMAIWVVVQRAWRRTFPDIGGDEDALAARGGCGGCSHQAHCDMERGDREATETRDLDPESFEKCLISQGGPKDATS